MQSIDKSFLYSRPLLLTYPYPGSTLDRFVTHGKSPYADRIAGVLTDADAAYQQARRLASWQRVDVAVQEFPALRSDERWAERLKASSELAGGAVESWKKAVNGLGPLEHSKTGQQFQAILDKIEKDLPVAAATQRQDVVGAHVLSEQAESLTYEASHMLRYLELKSRPLHVTRLGAVTSVAGAAALAGVATWLHAGRHTD